MPRKIRYPLVSGHTIHILDSYIKSPPMSFWDGRNKLLFSLFLNQGIKTSIVQRLTYNNYDTQDNILCIPLDNKLRKYIELVPEITTVSLLNYFLRFPHQSHDRIIRNASNKIDSFGLPITVRQIQRIIQEVGQSLRLPRGLNPRTLRHLCAVRLTQESLKHKSLDHLIGRVSPWVFTEYKRYAGNF